MNWKLNAGTRRPLLTSYKILIRRLEVWRWSRLQVLHLRHLGSRLVVLFFSRFVFFSWFHSLIFEKNKKRAGLASELVLADVLIITGLDTEIKRLLQWVKKLMWTLALWYLIIIVVRQLLGLTLTPRDTGHYFLCLCRINMLLIAEDCLAVDYDCMAAQSGFKIWKK